MRSLVSDFCLANPSGVLLFEIALCLCKCSILERKSNEVAWIVTFIGILFNWLSGLSLSSPFLYWIHISHQVPQQKNDYDCGLFVLFFMERFIEEAPERLKKKDLAMVYFLFKNFFFFNLHLWFDSNMMFPCLILFQFSVWKAVVQTWRSIWFESENPKFTDERIAECKWE